VKVSILNGNPDPQNKTFEKYIEDLDNQLNIQNHQVQRFTLREMSLKYCTGCWACWVKTPGKCIFPDDSSLICKAAVESKLLLFASPIVMGFTSAVLKKGMDKLIPLVHPYIEISHGECHHRSRYEHYPLLGLLMEKSPGSDEEDIAVITQIYHRLSLNFKSKLGLVQSTDTPIEEVINEINHL